MTRQLSFDWPRDTAMGEGDFFVSGPNAEARAQLDAPQAWPRGKLCLTGPKGCGKSHLAQIFAARHGATVLNTADLTPDTHRPEGPTVIEDADLLPQDCEEWLFHLHNALALRAPLLLTARTEPARWHIRLPDLASRMQATTVARIGEPDEALLAAIMVKLFTDRQIAPAPDLTDYLLPRIERSYQAVQTIVSRLDRAGLAHGRPVTKQLAVDLLNHRLPTPSQARHVNVAGQEKRRRNA